jgi:hypothetical protein
LIIALCVGLGACGDSGASKKDAKKADAKKDEKKADEKKTQKPKPKRPAYTEIRDQGLATPESILHDETDDVYLVSNINGKPTEKDDNGFISRVTPDGGVDDLKWLDGSTEKVTLNAPKGMAIHGTTLYVTDIDVVRQFDRVSGEQKDDIAIEGASFLNDVTAASNGTVYVSDTGVDAEFKPAGTDAVYAIKDGKVEKLFGDAELGGPNGVFWDGTDLWVVTFRANRLLRWADGKLEAHELPKGGLDGIVQGPGGNLLISSWEAQAVYVGSAAGGKWTTMATDVKAPADIGWDGLRSQLLIPLFEDDAVQFRPLR